MRYLIIFMLLCGVAWGEEIEFKAEDLIVPDDCIIKFPEPSKYLLFELEKAEYKLSGEDILSMTDEEIDKMTVLIRLCTSGAFYDPILLDSLCRKYLPNRFRKEK